MDLSDDVFQWVWRCDNTYFVCAVEDGRLGYILTNKDGITISPFWVWFGAASVAKNPSYQKHMPYINPSLYGPHQPPVSPVIKKIREMAKRRVHA